MIGADWGSKNTGANPLINAAQTLTTSYADLGFRIPTLGCKYMGIWIKLTRQQSSGVRIKVLAKHTDSGAEEYNLPIKTISSDVINISPEEVGYL